MVNEFSNLSALPFLNQIFEDVKDPVLSGVVPFSKAVSHEVHGKKVLYVLCYFILNVVK